jgi:ankyrin repeat protein
MKSQLIAIVAAVLVVGCGPPDISIHKAAYTGNIEAVKQHVASGADVNARDRFGGETPLDVAIMKKEIEIGALLSSHGGKTGEELKAGEQFAEAAKPERRTRKVPDTIHRAAVSGNIQAVKKHLADGADVNAKSRVG